MSDHGVSCPIGAEVLRQTRDLLIRLHPYRDVRWTLQELMQHRDDLIELINLELQSHDEWDGIGSTT